MLIKFAMDWNCYDLQRLKDGRVGGTERFMKMLSDYCARVGHEVFTDPEDGGEYEVGIYSNSYSDRFEARNKICFAGSWHTDALSAPYDEIVWVSQYTKDRMKADRGVVIPACIEPEIIDYKTSGYVQNRIVTTANPNRFIEHANEICKILESFGVELEWFITGGNKLYSESFGGFSQPTHRFIKYAGVMSRYDLLNLLATAHIFVYPNFTNDSETLGVSPIEAAMLGIPVVVPKREPFYETMRESAFYVSNVDECVGTIEFLLHERVVLPFGGARFEYPTVMKQWGDLIARVISESDNSLNSCTENCGLNISYRPV